MGVEYLIVDQRQVHIFFTVDSQVYPKLTGSGIADGIAGDIPSYIDPPKGCRFASRCPRCTPECLEAPPVLESVDGREDWMVACHHAGEEAMA